VRTFTAAALALSLLAAPAIAASPKVDEAIKTVRALTADANRLKTFCAFLDEMEKTPDKDGPAGDAVIDKYVKLLGADFQTAWDTIEGVDENSADGKAIDAVLQEKCH
jgi:hypothetical protein